MSQGQHSHTAWWPNQMNTASISKAKRLSLSAQSFCRSKLTKRKGPCRMESAQNLERREGHRYLVELDTHVRGVT